jgi:hypothetical protein
MEAPSAERENCSALSSWQTVPEVFTDNRYGDEQFNIRISDLEVLLERMTVTDDGLVQQYCVDRTRFKMEHIIKRINSRMKEIHALWPDASSVELYIAFEVCQESLDDFLASIATPSFRAHICAEAEERLESLPFAVDSHCETRRPDDCNGMDVSDKDSSSSDSEDDSDFTCEPDPVTPVAVRSCPRKMTSSGSVSSLPCPRGVNPTVWSGWSEARKRSYGHAKDHPNAYYYRHLPEGEVQRSGPWTAKEKQLFLGRMRELRGDAASFGHDWGLFSRAIPGRVGYQCSNFYRALLLSGELKDSQYVHGEDGRLHHTSHIRDGQVQTYRKGKNRAFKAASISCRSEVKDKPSDNEPQLGRYDAWAARNPIPGAVDFITGEVMRVPAMSPDGYVLDYQTWLDSLAEKSVNPFTQNHLTKRQLVILTTENYAEYAHKIVNLNDH